MKKKTPLFSIGEKIGFAALLVLGVSLITTNLVSVSLQPRVSKAQGVARVPALLYSETLLPISDGVKNEWAPSVEGTDVHATMVNEEACDGTATHLSTLTARKKELFTVDIGRVPDFAQVTAIEMRLCASNASEGNTRSEITTLARINNGRVVSGRKVRASGVEPVELSAVFLTGRAVFTKVATSTLQVGFEYAGGALGARVSRVAVRLKYRPLLLPAAPTELRATNQNAANMLRWRDNANNEDGFVVESSVTGPDGPWAELARPAANATSYQHNAIPRDQTIQYRVRAFNLDGFSASSGVVAAVNAVNPPAAPTNAAASSTNEGVVIQWIDHSTNEQEFRIERFDDRGSVRDVSFALANTTSYVDRRAPSDDGLSYRIYASNARGRSATYAASNRLVRYTRAPGAPANLRVTASTTILVSTWTRSTTNTEGFLLERGVDEQSFIQVASLDGALTASYADAGLPAGVYYYRVRAYNRIGNSPYSGTASARVP